jgi:hypothetical protein
VQPGKGRSIVSWIRQPNISFSTKSLGLKVTGAWTWTWATGAAIVLTFVDSSGAAPGIWGAEAGTGMSPVSCNMLPSATGSSIIMYSKPLLVELYTEQARRNITNTCFAVIGTSKISILDYKNGFFGLIPCEKRTLIRKTFSHY